MPAPPLPALAALFTVSPTAEVYHQLNSVFKPQLMDRHILSAD